MKLNEVLKILLKSGTPNIQLDFFRRNNQILIQVYKQRDVANWKKGFILTDLDGLVIELTFHKDKTDNLKNLERFNNSSLFQKFRKVDAIEQNSFFYGISSSTRILEIEQFLLKLIKDIYFLDRIELEKMYFTLNAY